ncbi:hypothetical protein FRC11_003555, partial [Ceratobasidium sp. 423]
YLRKLFCDLFVHDLFIREGYQYDYVFDWSVHPPSPNRHPYHPLQRQSTPRVFSLRFHCR